MQQQKITTFFWFETQAEAAAKFYVDLFAPRSRIISTDRFGDSVMSVSFELEGQRYVALIIPRAELLRLAAQLRRVEAPASGIIAGLVVSSCRHLSEVSPSPPRST